MSTTTPAAIRDLLASRVAALVPGTLAANRFLEHRYELPFAEWAAANPGGAFRRFAVTEADEIEPPDVTDGLTEAVFQDFTIEVAYPVDHRAGSQQRTSLANLLSADRAQIAKTVGTNGFATYAAQVPPCAVITTTETRSDLGPVWLGIVRLRVRYFRDATP